MTAIDKYVHQQIPIAPLAVFRALFGFIMLVSIIRFAYRGWIQELYIDPDFFFKYCGFEWVQPLGRSGMYLIFALMGLSALAVMLGLFYRVAIVLFFTTFTYVELIDLTNYLNHYYFVSIVSFLLIFVPANRAFSLDVIRDRSLLRATVPAWTINIFKIQLGIVYCYAGLAKLNVDWLFRAMPLKIWLPAKSHLPVIGFLFNYKWTPFVFSWFGAIYDLFIVFFLLNRKTRIYAYGAVIIFHLLTLYLFQIGMFPYIMILSTLIFFPASFHQQVIDRFSKISPFSNLTIEQDFSSPPLEYPSYLNRKLLNGMLAVYLAFQLLFPFRYLLYPGQLFWTEQGYRFSWRVMLMEKAGYVVFHIHDPVTGKREQVRNYDYLTPNQEKMMSTQPDMILQFAHFLADEYHKKGFEKPVITAESYVTLNGRRSQPLIDPTINLVDVQQVSGRQDWLLPLNTGKN